jgi:hypothetical protein
MFTIFRSPKGIHLIDVLPKGGRFNSSYFGQNILYGLHVILPPTRIVRPILIHMDNASPRRSKRRWPIWKNSIFDWCRILYSRQVWRHLIFIFSVQSREGWDGEPFKTLGNFWKRSVKLLARFGPLDGTPYFATEKTNFENVLNWMDNRWTETMLKW